MPTHMDKGHIRGVDHELNNLKVNNLIQADYVKITNGDFIINKLN